MASEYKDEQNQILSFKEYRTQRCRHVVRLEMFSEILAY